MGTRGLYGIRKNNIDKTTYNHFDSYPEGLGADMLKFIRKHSNAALNEFYDNIIMVAPDAIPTKEEIAHCAEYGFINLTVSNQSTQDWYCLLRETQGNLEILFECDYPYMIDNRDFIKDSLFCEYAYIINLDTNVLEYYEGFQTTPQAGNRYGVKEDRGYYPCKRIAEIPLDVIKNARSVEDIIHEFMRTYEE